MDYYKELILNIENKIKNGDLKQASSLIEAELALPYVPKDVLKKLNELKSNLVLETKVERLSDEEIVEYLKGDGYHQLIAVDYLDKLNRIDRIKAYLLKHDDKIEEVEKLLYER